MGREAAGGELAGGEADAPGPVRAVIDTREARAGRPVRRAPRAHRRRRRVRAGRPRGRAWGALVAPEHAERAVAATAGAAPVIAVDDPLAGAAGAGPRLAARAGLQGRGRDRVDRQDLDQGHPRGDPVPAASHPLQPREPEHRDRAAAHDPRGAGRHRGDGAGDGDARRGPDRRAGGRRRARRGRDRERGPRAPRAARHGRPGGRRQGGADPRPSRRAPRAWSRRASRCWRPTCATTSTRSPSAPAAR